MRMSGTVVVVVIVVVVEDRSAIGRGIASVGETKSDAAAGAADAVVAAKGRAAP